MVFPQVIVAFLAGFDAIGLPGNLLVIITIVLQRKFHVMRCILLASLAITDFLFLILVNSFRMASIAQERWPYGETMCYLNPFFARYSYINTVFHLIAASYDRYSAIVKSPLTYSGMMTSSKVAFMVLIWIIPIVFCIDPFLGGGKYVYNSDVFFCQQQWMTRTDSSRWKTAMAVLFFVVPFLAIALMNWSVYKTAKTQANATQVQIGSLEGREGQKRDNSKRRMAERKAAYDVIIVVAVFFLCYLPTWILGLCGRFVKSTDVPPEATLVTSCLFMFTSACNPIIYSIRKRDFRTCAKKMFLRRVVGLKGRVSDNGMVGGSAIHGAEAPAGVATEHQYGAVLDVKG